MQEKGKKTTNHACENQQLALLIQFTKNNSRFNDRVCVCFQSTPASSSLRMQ